MQIIYYKINYNIRLYEDTRNNKLYIKLLQYKPKSICKEYWSEANSNIRLNERKNKKNLR